MEQTKYSGIVFSDTGPRVLESEAEQFFSRYGMTIPESYMRFILAVNGGIPRPSGFSLAAELAMSDESQERASPEHTETLASLCSSGLPIDKARQQIEFECCVRFPHRVTRFLSVNGGVRPTLNSILQMRLAVEAATDRIPIAFEESGIPISLSLATSTYEHVFLGDDEEETADQISEVLIATSFDGFLSAITPARPVFLNGYKPSDYLFEMHRLDEYDE